MELPMYYITFDPEQFESGIDLIAITENPAIELFSLKFSKQEKQEPIRFKFDKEKQIIAGPVAIPNKPIYRKDSDGKEYYVIFTPETIEQMAEKFSREQREIKFNLEHRDDELVEGFIKGSWIIEDPERDKSKYYGFTDLPKGSFFVEAKITDDAKWKIISEMEFVGFSLEGLLGVEKIQFKSINPDANKTKVKMKKTKLKFLAKRIEAKKKFNVTSKSFESQLVVSEDEEILIVEETLEVGSPVEIVTEDGTLEDAPNGDYQIDTEEVIVSVEDGKVADVVETTEDAPADTEEEMAKDDKDEKKDMAEEDEKEETMEDEVQKDAEMIAKMVELESRIEALEAKFAEEVETETFTKTKTKTKFNQSRAEKLELLKRL